MIMQLGIIGYYFSNATNCQFTKSYTNTSENIDLTNISQFLAIFA